MYNYHLDYNITKGQLLFMSHNFAFFVFFFFFLKQSVTNLDWIGSVMCVCVWGGGGGGAAFISHN